MNNVIDDLKRITSQINEKKVLLNTLTNERIPLDDELKVSLANALNDIESQIKNALRLKTLSELSLILPNDKIEELIAHDDQIRGLQAKIEGVKDTISSLFGDRGEVLKASHAVLADYNTEFWRISLDHGSEYEFKSDEISITLFPDTVKIPYLRFTEDEKEIVEKIKPLIEKRKLKERLEKADKYKAALIIKLNALDEKISRNQANS